MPHVAGSDQLHVGVHVAYKGEGLKRVRIGKVLGLSPLERSVTLHKYMASTDARLRVEWKPVFFGEEGQEVAGAGARPSLQTVPYDTRQRI